MMTRSLHVLFQNELLLNLTLPPTDLSEKDSAKEFVDAIVKYKAGIARFRSRKPDLSIGKQMKLVSSIDDAIHTIINARKYIDIPVAPDVYIEQVFVLNFISNSMSINCVKTKDTILSMYFDTMFDNWIDIAFPAEESSEVVELPEPEPEIELESESESDLHPNTEQMKAELSPGMFEFWNYCVNVRRMPDKIEISYSGSGDSGGTDDVISIYDLGRDADFDHHLWLMIQNYEGGFYNNEGGYGNITVSAYLFEWEHNNYIHETETTIAVSASMEKPKEPEPEPEEDDEEFFDYEPEKVEIEEDDDEDEEYFDEIEADDRRHFKDED